MDTNYITVRNTLNGEVTRVHRRILSNLHMMEYLVVVDEDAKPLSPTLHKPQSAEEFVAARPGKKVSTPDSEDV